MDYLIPYASGITTAVVIMIIMVLISTTCKLWYSHDPVSIGTIFLEYFPMCLWSIIAYRLIKYDHAVYEGYIPIHKSSPYPDYYEDRVAYMRDTYDEDIPRYE